MAKKQKSGLYRSKVKIGIKPDGSDDFKYISGKTQRELEEARQQVLEHYVSGRKASADKPFGLCAQEWFSRLQKASIESSGKSASSLESYQTALNKDILPVFGDRNMRAIQPGELQDFVDQFTGRSQTKITYICATLNGIFKTACKDKVLYENPFEHVERPLAREAVEKRPLTTDERQRVVSTASTHPHGAYLACLYYLGARPGEVRGLQWMDFDWERGLVHIQRDIDYKKHGSDKVGTLKNQKSNRFVPIPADLRKILTPLESASSEFLFQGSRSGNCLSKTTAERMWVELMNTCGMVEALPEGSNAYRPSDIRSHYKPIITPHTMRHNYVTMCWEKGIDVYTASKLVGHKSIKTTMDIYTHLSETQMEKTKKLVEIMFAPEK